MFCLFGFFVFCCCFFFLIKHCWTWTPASWNHITLICGCFDLIKSGHKFELTHLIFTIYTLIVWFYIRTSTLWLYLWSVLLLLHGNKHFFHLADMANEKSWTLWRKNCMLKKMHITILFFTQFSHSLLHYKEEGFIEGSQPELCISSMMNSRDTPFWSGTLVIYNPLAYVLDKFSHWYWEKVTSCQQTWDFSADWRISTDWEVPRVIFGISSNPLRKL